MCFIYVMIYGKIDVDFLLVHCIALIGKVLRDTLWKTEFMIKFIEEDDILNWSQI